MTPTKSEAQIIREHYQRISSKGGSANTDAQNKARRANLKHVKAKRGRKPTCTCGTCQKCKMRLYQQRRREQQRKESK